ncbi:MAG: M15 family metallopeptidase [Actinobacteria bacterium]|nr:M15 family metallopeptidase [Actinomycetota bacterium]
MLSLLVAGILPGSGKSRADPVLGEPEAPILLVYGPADVVPELAAAARRISDTQVVTEVGNGTGWLTSWKSVEDDIDSVAPEGFSIPLEILSIDPDSYEKFVPAGRKEAFRRLDEGGALMGRSAAAFRAIESEGRLAFGETSVDVIAAVEDDLIASHEVVVSHETAETLGISDRKYVLIALGRGLEAGDVLDHLSDEFPDLTIGAREPGDSRYFRPGGDTLPQIEIKKAAGEFAAKPQPGGELQIYPKWIVANTVNEPIPLLGRARCHRKVFPQIKAAFEQVAAQGLEHLVDDDNFGGCFAPRLLNDDPHSGISRHAWGIAFDFNVSNNLYGRSPSMDPRLVEIMEDWGFVWGGRWRIPDGMHFEYLQPAGSVND